MTTKQAINDLNKQLRNGTQLLEKQPPCKIADLREWKIRTASHLRRILGSDSPILISFQTIAKEYERYGWASGNSRIDFFKGKSMVKPFRKQLEHVKLAVELLNARQQEEEEGVKNILITRVQRKKVFVVHGHNEKSLSKTKNFLNELQLEPVVLREQPNQGQTIIEKLEKFSQVVFAVVLLTPDDIGGSKSGSHEKQHFRARQNVILELGFFLGKLGRQRVCVLYSHGVEIPSDYQGVLYVEFDESNMWKNKLAEEIKAAGILT